MSGDWSNWSGEVTCRPAVHVRPTTVEEVCHAIVRARDTGHVVRAAGAGHSFTPLVATEGTLISLDRLNRVMTIDEAAGTIRVQAGMSLRDLNAHLASADLALANLGDIDVQSVAGAIATGTHGTGRALPNLSAFIDSVELVTAGGSVIEIAASDPMIGAARLSLGALGVVTAVTLRVTQAFNLEAVDEPRPLDEVLANLDALVAANDHFEFYTFPHGPLAHTRTNNRTGRSREPRSVLRTWAEDEFLRNHVLAALFRVGRRFPRSIPAVSRTIPRLAGRTERVDRSFEIFCSARRFRFTEMEYAVPIEHAVDAVTEVRRIADRKDLDVSMPIEVRFAAADDSFLSPAYGRETCYVAVHAFEGMAFSRYFADVQAVMRSLSGRPHWGKQHSLSADDLSEIYPRFGDFLAVRDDLDPKRVFSGPYARKLLG